MLLEMWEVDTVNRPGPLGLHNTIGLGRVDMWGPRGSPRLMLVVQRGCINVPVLLRVELLA